LLTETAVVLVKIGFVLAAVLNFALLLTWVERKQSAVMQDRIGANRASIFGIRALGLFHNLADGIKMFTKEDFVPATADRFLHGLAPFLALFCALVTFAVLPFGDVLRWGEREIRLQVVELDIGLLFIFAFAALGIYGAVLAGWASGNKWSLLGSLRAAAQMLSYEVTLGLTIVGVIMVYGSLELNEIARGQGDLFWGLPKWGILVQPLGFILFMTAAIAESKRIPFDVPEGESEIIGYQLEYSGMKFGAFMLTDFVESIMAAGVAATLFLGGWQVPYLQAAGFVFPWGTSWELPHLAVVALEMLAFLLKVALLSWLQMQIRWTLPRFRYDQVIRLGWQMLLPLSLANVFATGAVLLLLR
jgi:NADH-quinone oxidoreductase subunit H